MDNSELQLIIDKLNKIINDGLIKHHGSFYTFMLHSFEYQMLSFIRNQEQKIKFLEKDKLVLEEKMDMWKSSYRELLREVELEKIKNDKHR